METSEDEKRFRNMLSSCKKKELIDLITDQAIRYPQFETYVNERFRHNESLDELLANFLKQYVRYIDDPSSVSIDRFCEGADVFMEKMESYPASVSKAKAYLTVSNEIDELINGGLGWYNDSDFLAVQIAKECIENIYEIAQAAVKSGDERFISDIKDFLDEAKFSDGCICLGKEWDKIKGLFS